MRIALTTTVVAAALLLAGCSSSTTPSHDTAAGSAPASPAAKAAKQLTAEQALAALAKSIPTAKQTGVVTAESDPNSLLGRPGQYTSKVNFSDSRIGADKTKYSKDGDVELGGAIEVFATADDAKKRADYIQNIVKNMPMLMEYDFPHGTILIRVSHFLAPEAAADYDRAGSKLG